MGMGSTDGLNDGWEVVGGEEGGGGRDFQSVFDESPVDCGLYRFVME